MAGAYHLHPCRRCKFLVPGIVHNLELGKGVWFLVLSIVGVLDGTFFKVVRFISNIFKISGNFKTKNN